MVRGRLVFILEKGVLMTEKLEDWLTRSGTSWQRNFSVTDEDAPAFVEGLSYLKGRNLSESVSKLIVRAVIDQAHCLKELESLG